MTGRLAITTPEPPLDVLLLDAQSRQTLAAIRALGQTGLTVGVVACQSEAGWAASLQSRFCALAVVVPDLFSGAQAYAQALLDALDQHPARLVVPASDGTLHALRLRRADFERRAALALASEAALEIATSKSRTLALARELGLAVPRSVPVTDSRDVPAAVGEVGLPAVIKPATSWVEQAGLGRRLSASVVTTLAAATQAASQLLAQGTNVLVQEWLPGRREAVSLFLARDRCWARLAQMSYREWPVLGGASVMCETISLPADSAASAERLVRAMNLEGYSMVEFRRDRQGQPVLMEVNARLGGSLALALAAGVNFAEMLYCWQLGRPLAEVRTYRAGRRLRWLAADVWNLKHVFRNQGQPDVPPRLGAAAQFAVDFLRPNVGYGLEQGDLRPLFGKVNNLIFHDGAQWVRSRLHANV
jgi:predicted ATP-grasp superfamily ATP-dependent carboligase